MLIPKYGKSFEGVTKFVNVAMNVKHVKLDSSFAKHLSIAYPNLGPQFLVQVKRHYDLCYDESQINREKLEQLIT